MDEKRLSIILGGITFATNCIMSLWSTWNYVGLFIGAFIALYGFIGPLNLHDLRFINPFSQRIKLSDASLFALEKLEKESINKISESLSIPKLQYYAHALADGHIYKGINVYGRKPPSRIIRLIEDKNDYSHFTSDANSTTDLSGNIIYTDIEIEKKWLKFFILKNKEGK